MKATEILFIFCRRSQGAMVRSSCTDRCPKGPPKGPDPKLHQASEEKQEPWSEQAGMCQCSEGLGTRGCPRAHHGLAVGQVKVQDHPNALLDLTSVALNPWLRHWEEHVPPSPPWPTLCGAARCDSTTTELRTSQSLPKCKTTW